MRFLALDWDRREARAVVVERTATGTRLVQAVSATLDSETSSPDGKLVGRRLAEELGSAARGRPHTIVGVGRDHVQLQRLTLPPAPPEELPELVRFQAQRELTSLAEDAPLDYLTLSTSAEETQIVLAAALAAEGQAAVKATCGAMGTDAATITLRSSGAASLLMRATEFDPQAVALLVCPLAEEADLIVVADDQPVLMRTVRIPAGPQDADQPEGSTDTDTTSSTEASLAGFMAVGLDRRHAALASEIRRTLAVARQQLGARRVDIVYLAGNVKTAEVQAALIARGLDLPCVVFDPFRDVPPLAGQQPEDWNIDSGRLTATFGMALDAAEEKRATIDFLNVRRRLDVQSVRRVHVLAAAAVLVALLGYVWHLYSEIAYPRRMTEQYRTEISELEAQLGQYTEVKSQAAAVERWLSTDVNWLDELQRLSLRVRPAPLDADDFPVADDALVTSLVMQRPRRGLSEGGLLKVTAATRSPAAVAPLEARLRDDQREVTSGRGQRDETVPDYPWQFDVEMTVPPADAVPPAERPKTEESA